MSSGTVKFFNTSKGFGFVTPDEGSADIFLPAAAVTSSGVTNLKAGQRVAYEHVADVKGPKIVQLKLLDDPIVKIPAPPPPVAPVARVDVHCDSNSEIAMDVLDAIQDCGFQLQTLDYVVVPPTVDTLRRLSHMLMGAGQNLAKRYDPLFQALQLDDRFIGEHDFWTGIAEHPSLINGPVLVHSDRARVCKTASEVREFLGKGGAAAAPSRKKLSPRLAAMLKGEAFADLPPEPEDIIVEPVRPVLEERPPQRTVDKIVLTPKERSAVKPLVVPPAKEKPIAETPVVKKVAAVKPSAKKPAAAKPAATKPAAAKTAIKKTAAAKPAVKKAPAKKTAVKKAVAKAPAKPAKKAKKTKR